MALRLSAARRVVFQGLRRYHDPAVVAHPEYEKVFTGTDISMPANCDRKASSPDLAAKEQGAWAKLSREDALALYRTQYDTSLAEYMEEIREKDTPWVFFGCGVALLASVGIFEFCQRWVSPPPPHTCTDEFREANRKKMTVYNMNPILGHSSPK